MRLPASSALRRHLPALCVLAAAFTASLWLSYPYRRRADPQTSHVLVSMRALDAYGFRTLRGASVMTPTPAGAPELAGVDPRLFAARDNSTYMSYPDGWLILPYAALSAVRVLSPQATVNERFLHKYNLLADRLLASVLLYALLTLVLAALTDGRLVPPARRLIAAAGASFWLLSPPVLYWTQNAYGMDQAVIPAVLAFTAFVASKRCRLDALRGAELGLLFLLSFLCAFLDWYGWVAILVTGAACLGVLAASPSPRRWGRFAIAACAAAGGVLLAGLIFLLQLLSFRDGFLLLAGKYAMRTGAPIAPEVFLAQQWAWWLEYLPLPVTWAGIALIALSCAACVFLLRRLPARAPAAGLLAILLVPPFLCTALLREHASEHAFSLLKFSVPTSAAAAIMLAWAAASARRRIASAIVAAAVALPFVPVAFTVYEPMPVGGDEDARTLRTLMVQLGEDVLPLADEHYIRTFLPMMRVWYMDRWIYRPAALKDLIGRKQVNMEALATLRPAYLKTTGGDASPEAERICAGLWTPTGLGMISREILACRTDALRALYMP